MSDEPQRESEGPPAEAPASNEATSEHGEHENNGFRHTRTSAAWVAIAVAVLFGIALIDFIAQNTRDVRIEFFTARGQIPIAVALLAAALCGAVVVLAIGVGRVAQLRLNMRRERHRARDEHRRRSNEDTKRSR